MSFLSDLFGGNGAAKDQMNFINAGLNTASNFTNQANKNLTNYFEQALPYFSSLYGTGNGGLSQLGDLLGLNGAAGSNNALTTLKQTPGYQFNLGQGDNAINAAAAANGTLGSGNQALALSKFNQGLASNTYNNYVSQLQPYMNLATSAAGGAGNILTGLGSGISSNLTGLGNDYLSGLSAEGAAQANADLSNAQGLGGLLKGIAGLGTNTIGGGLLSSAGSGLMSIFSDERLKEDIAPVGELYDGTNIYSYRYKGDPVPRIGVMAQEIEKTNPDAVTEIGGFKAVNYGKATSYAAELGKLFKEAA